MMRALLLAALLTQPVMALEPGDVFRCLDLLPTDRRTEAKVELTVELNTDGTISKAEVSGYTPDDEAGFRIAQAVYDALVACAPYPGASATSKTITLMFAAHGERSDLPQPDQQ